MKGISIAEFRGKSVAAHSSLFLPPLRERAERGVAKEILHAEKEKVQLPSPLSSPGPGLRMGVMFGQVCKGWVYSL